MKAVSRLIKVNFKKKIDTSEGLDYTTASNTDGQPWEESEARSRKSSGVNLLDNEKLDHSVQHTFPANLGWAPDRIEINGRKGRQVVFVLSKDMKHYRIYDIGGDNDAEGNEASQPDSHDNMII